MPFEFPSTLKQAKSLRADDSICQAALWVMCISLNSAVAEEGILSVCQQGRAGNLQEQGRVGCEP